MAGFAGPRRLPRPLRSRTILACVDGIGRVGDYDDLVRKVALNFQVRSLSRHRPRVFVDGKNVLACVLDWGEGGAPLTANGAPRSASATSLSRLVAVYEGADVRCRTYERDWLSDHRCQPIHRR